MHDSKRFPLYTSVILYPLLILDIVSDNILFYKGFFFIGIFNILGGSLLLPLFWESSIVDLKYSVDIIFIVIEVDRVNWCFPKRLFLFTFEEELVLMPHLFKVIIKQFHFALPFPVWFKVWVRVLSLCWCMIYWNNFFLRIPFIFILRVSALMSTILMQIWCLFIVIINKLIILSVLVKIRVELRVKLLPYHIFIFLINILIAYLFVNLRKDLLLFLIRVRCWKIRIVRWEVNLAWRFFYYWKIDTIIWLFENSRALVGFTKKVIGVFCQFSFDPIFIPETKVWII